jgi:molecular chaperone GrpE
MKKKDTKEKIDNKEQEEAKVTDKEQVEEVDNSTEESEEEAAEEVELSPEEKTKAELAEAKDKYLRLYSEFDNFRRRTAKEKLDMLQTAGERIMVALLPVIDDFNRAEKSLESDDAEAIAEGIKLIADKFNKTLTGEGLKKMDTEPGTDFDTELHDAVTQIPAPSKKLKGKIVDTIENGYYLGEKVIRHAKVVIGS